MIAATGAREHRVFPGKLDKRVLGLAERAIVAVVRVPEGDYRDWPAVREWASHIAEQLQSERPAV
jgi:menaquinone-dependent protoporphyrinogen oxidase